MPACDTSSARCAPTWRRRNDRQDSLEPRGLGAGPSPEPRAQGESTVPDAPLVRATKDLDFLGRLDNSLENLERVVQEVCTADVEPDGMVFDPATVKTERIKEDADYEGVRIRFVGLLGTARVAMQLDVGFGDVVTPGAQDVSYPTLLDFPAPALSGYPRETVVAEKFQAMVYLSTLNSRMKDFYDVWLLARQFAFDGVVLAKAVASTFAHRETIIDVVPIARACERGEGFEHQWPPSGPWTASA